MPENVFNDIYSIAGKSPVVSCVPGGKFPAKLSLTFVSPINLRPALSTPPSGAILDVHLSMESVVELSSQIQEFLKTMGK